MNSQSILTLDDIHEYSKSGLLSYIYYIFTQHALQYKKKL